MEFDSLGMRERGAVTTHVAMFATVATLTCEWHIFAAKASSSGCSLAVRGVQ